MKTILLAIMAVFLFNCGGMGGFGTLPQITPQRSGGLGFGAGVAAEKAKDKIVESLTPVYPLYYMPAEICSPVQDESGETVIGCTIVPCENAPEIECQKNYTVQEFLEYSPYYVTSQSFTSREGAIIEFLKKNPDAVVQELGKYEGGKLVIVD